MVTDAHAHLLEVITEDDATELKTGAGDAEDQSDLGKKKRKRKKKNKKKTENSSTHNGFAGPIDGSIEGEASQADKSRKTAREKFRQCDNCNNSITASIRLCSGCKKVCYCNRDCQKAHWKDHKKTCSYVVKKELTG